MTVVQELVTESTDAPVGAAVRPKWERKALAALLAGTAVLYLWALGAMGWANEFYAAAVQAGTQSGKAWLFGSLDAGNAITVDKPPAAMWVMGLSGRLFGFNSWSMLVPQALMGVAAVALIYAAVRRTNGAAAGLLAGTVLALTPVAALMFRFNNPDALLVLLLVAAGYCIVRALGGHPTRWVACAGVALGFAFLAKLLQAFLVVPALALVVLVAVPGSVWARLRDLLVGLVAMIASGGWFVALVSLWPADSRPYIGGSTDNSLLQLTLGYNGLGRVLGGDGNPTHGSGDGPGGGGGPGGAMFGGNPGVLRMFGESMGTEISWLLPAALIGLVAGLWFTRRAPRTDLTRAALLLWGGWLVSTTVVFSSMKGIMHPYYTIALAPGVAAVVAIATRELWRGRQFRSSRIVLGGMLAVTGVWSFVLLDRTPDWQPWLRWTVLVGAIAVAAILMAGAHALGSYTAAVAAAGLLFGLAGTAAYTVETVLDSHGGAIPTSGPDRGGKGFPGGPGGPGGPSGPGGPERASDAVQAMLKDTDNRWAAATVGSHLAGDLMLKTQTSIMAIGGFNGGDNSPTLEQFQQYVADGQVRYFITDAGRPGPPGAMGGDGSGAEISEWVQAAFPFEKVDGMTVYDLQN
ncbi:glycosyltransferase family 39 protein [Mycolicibacterium confluentis]|uniref:Glycosyl transferase n=1 Tax=Mycolicibacterium confluentis TaxID=28047 RepID=A0A7I7Y4Y9_9MYCO|nr:glycosyltransferase family 39 protein [Mycolicibacterium confluentis]MCV7319122.1 glycosyltransferase family 39 protein [Mycolicibacterium confluentis]ORV24842.1 glycosyl transferase [Mycolicibacterium confluentis]BBZ36735.1 glycosyl transferase [Mycolicibacterium confluentis]